VVTLEDIVEEIIGEIRDEYDGSEELPYEQVGPDEFVFQGKVDLDLFNEVMGTNISTEKIPQEFWKPIEEAALNALNDGPLISGNVERVNVELVDGSFNPVDSNELAFRIATSLAMGKALRASEPLIMEPVMLLTVLCPEDFVGDVIADINSKRGRISDVRKHNDFQQEIVADVPLSELFGYATRVRSISQGRAVYTLEFKRYEITPPSIQSNVLKRIRGYAE